MHSMIYCSRSSIDRGTIDLFTAIMSPVRLTSREGTSESLLSVYLYASIVLLKISSVCKTVRSRGVRIAASEETLTDVYERR